MRKPGRAWPVQWRRALHRHTGESPGLGGPHRSGGGKYFSGIKSRGRFHHPKPNETQQCQYRSEKYLAHMLAPCYPSPIHRKWQRLYLGVLSRIRPEEQRTSTARKACQRKTNPQEAQTSEEVSKAFQELNLTGGRSATTSRFGQIHSSPFMCPVSMSGWVSFSGRRETVRFGKATLWLLTVLSLSLANSLAAASDPLAQVLNGRADDDAISRAIGSLRKSDCGKPLCLALRDMDNVARLQIERDLPNSMARLHPEQFDFAERDAEMNVSIEKLLELHKDRWPLYCAILAKLAHHYDENYRQVGFHAMEIAGRISSQSLDCAALVVQALPDTASARDLMLNVLFVCRRENYPGCDLIARAMARLGIPEQDGQEAK